MTDAAQKPGNKYLQGNYAPVTEMVTETNLEVVGEIPKDLAGLMVRNGPNPMESPDAKTHHWFMGQGMLHGVRLDSGKALWYKNRLVSANGSQPNTHVISHANKIYALVEAGGAPVEVDPDLNSVEAKPFFGTLNTGFTAHTKFDADSGELHAMCYDYANQFESINYVVIGADGRHKKTRAIDLPSRTMLHECGITENYALVFDLSVTFSLDLLGKGYFPFAWNDEHQARIGLVDRHDDSKEVRWINVDPCYFFHIVNAYEDGQGKLVLDAMNYQRFFDKDRNGPFSEAPPMPTRWVIDLNSGGVTRQQWDDRAAEFPRIHPDLDGKQQRFGYAQSIGSSASPTFDSLIKYDFVNNSTDSYRWSPEQRGAEPVFVPAENARSEDQGYLLSYVYDRTEDKSDLMIINAQDVSAGPVAQIKLPTRVPFGFHGSWVNM